MKNPEYLEYDGKLLHWKNPRDGARAASCKATSGLTGHQVPTERRYRTILGATRPLRAFQHPRRHLHRT